jgi:replicative DNA helicase
MESIKIIKRHASIIAGIPFNKLSSEQKFHALQQAAEIETTVFDCSRPEIEYIETMSIMLSSRKPISVIVVDYLGLVQNKGNFERNDLKQADNVQRLSALAKKLNCIVIALSQINRKNTERAKADRCPYPEDAADSSGSHRASDLWIGVDRPELYDSAPEYSDLFVVKARKNRYGDPFEFNLSFNKGCFKEVPHNHFKKPITKNSKIENSLFGDKN